MPVKVVRCFHHQRRLRLTTSGGDFYAPPPVSLMDDQMVDMAFITQLTGLTDKWFYKLIKDGAFPAPIKLGRSSRWLKSEVEAWLQARIAQSRP